MKLGDIILKVGGVDVNSIADFRSVLDSKATKNACQIIHPKRKNSRRSPASGGRLLKIIRATSYLVALDVQGKQWSSEELAAKFETLAVSGKSDITFVIGGAFAPQVLAAAQERNRFPR